MDLVYLVVSYCIKKIIDMLGVVFFMFFVVVLVWFYGWYFMWCYLMILNILVFDMLEKVMCKVFVVCWNVEIIGFLLNGFNVYFFFKMLFLVYMVLVLMYVVVFFYCLYFECKEGFEFEGKYFNKDNFGDE